MEAALLDVMAELWLGHHHVVEADGHGTSHGVGHGVMDAALAAQKCLQGRARASVQQPSSFKDDFAHRTSSARFG
jgi:hypothetical protein